MSHEPLDRTASIALGRHSLPAGRVSDRADGKTYAEVRPTYQRKERKNG